MARIGVPVDSIIPRILFIPIEPKFVSTITHSHPVLQAHWSDSVLRPMFSGGDLTNHSTFAGQPIDLSQVSEVECYILTGIQLRNCVDFEPGDSKEIKVVYIYIILPRSFVTGNALYILTNNSSSS